jgi:very-short-patch-repair endonuclease
VPAELKRGPFTLADARRAGLTRWQLEGASWLRLGPRSYLWTGIAATPQIRLAALVRRLPPKSAFSGLTAAWLHGLDVDPCDPVEAIVPKRAGVSGRSGIVIRRSDLSGGEVVTLRGLKATSITRTLKDLCSQLSLTEAVVIADSALHLQLVTLKALKNALVTYAGQPGVEMLRSVVAHAEPASESLMETRLRMLLVLGGLPRPEAQVSIHDRAGRFLGRVDLFYRSGKLGLEYDGGTHRESLAADNRRQNQLVDAGVTVLRFSAVDVFQKPESTVALVRARLAA